MTRPILPFAPRWRGEIQGYAYNSLRRYWPALRPWYEWEDLTQEAYLVHLTCRRRYSARVDNAAWYMALFKTSWHNKMIDLIVSVPQYVLLDDEVLAQAPSSCDIANELWELALGLPRELQLVLADICRLKPRFHFSKRALRDLRTAVLAHCY